MTMGGRSVVRDQFERKVRTALRDAWSDSPNSTAQSSDVLTQFCCYTGQKCCIAHGATGLGFPMLPFTVGQGSTRPDEHGLELPLPQEQQVASALRACCAISVTDIAHPAGVLSSWASAELLTPALLTVLPPWPPHAPYNARN
eukprot:131030-Rhodomonas_salina.1